MIYRAKAPLRVSFAGGGTDVPPFCAREGGLVLSATISRYAYGTLQERSDGQITIESVDYGVKYDFGIDKESPFEGKLDLIEAAIRKLAPQPERGFDLFLHSNAPPGSGLGASSAVMVVVIGLLRELSSLPLTEYELADLAYTVERHDLGIKGGYQDQYAATFGGFNFLEFGDNRVIVNPLRVPEDVMHELEMNMLLYYTGKTRAGDHIIEDQVNRYEDSDEDALSGLRMQKELAVEMKNALLQRRLTDFGEMLGLAWEQKRKMSPRIATALIDDAYEQAVSNGAIGGKVTGAGGGGYMLFYCPFEKKHRVADALLRLGGRVTEFEFTRGGLATWRSHG